MMEPNLAKAPVKLVFKMMICDFSLTKIEPPNSGAWQFSRKKLLFYYSKKNKTEKFELLINALEWSLMIRDPPKIKLIQSEIGFFLKKRKIKKK